MARDSIKISEVQEYLQNQILTLQIDWMDYHNAGDEVMTRQQEVVLDGIYSFVERFLGVPAPATGQGYQPPPELYAATLKDRRVDQIDQQISDLVAQRETITGEPYIPPVTKGRATLLAVTELTAKPDKG
jgi:hypothetical protein